MHVEEVDRDRQRKDDSKRHMAGGQRQACRFCIAEELIDRDGHARRRGGQRQTEGG